MAIGIIVRDVGSLVWHHGLMSKKKGIVLHDESNPHADPIVVDSGEFTLFINSYPITSQQDAARRLMSGELSIKDRGPIKPSASSVDGLPLPDRVIRTDDLGAALRRCPDAWAKNAAKKIMRGDMSVHGSAIPRDETSSEQEGIVMFRVPGAPPKRTPARIPLRKDAERVRLLRERAREAIGDRQPHDGPLLATVGFAPSKDGKRPAYGDSFGWAVVEALMQIELDGVMQRPIVFLDDSQIANLFIGVNPDLRDEYMVVIKFL